MVTISTQYVGNLRIQATHGPSQCQLITHAPVDNHGRGESFSPTDLVATALASCILTILGIVAERDGIALTGTRSEVEKIMSSDAPRRIARLRVAIHLPAAMGESDRKKLEKAARSCPVRHSIHPDIVVEETYYWDIV